MTHQTYSMRLDDDDPAPQLNRRALKQYRNMEPVEHDTAASSQRREHWSTSVATNAMILAFVAVVTLLVSHSAATILMLGVAIPVVIGIDTFVAIHDDRAAYEESSG